MKYKVKKHISTEGYPLNSKDYAECHKFATQQEIKKFGIHHFHKLGILIPQHPTELLGTNKPSGKLYVSSIVPSNPHWEREEVAYHEEQESLCLKRKRESYLRKHKE